MNSSWRDTFSVFFENVSLLNSHEESCAAQRIPPEIRASQILGLAETHDVRLQPRLGIWCEISRAKAPLQPEQFSGGFRFELFRGNVFLIRDVRASDIKKCIQGFLINREKLLVALRATAQRKFPDSILEFCSNSEHPDISLCGLPMKFTAGTLTEEVVVNRELRNFRILLVGICGLCFAVSSGVLIFFWFVQRTAERKRVFVASVVHDLRSPVAGINALAENISKEMQKYTQHSRDLKQLVGRVRDLSSLLDNTLLFSRLNKSSRDILSFRDTIFGEIFPSIAERITERLDCAGCDFDSELSPEAENAKLYISPSAFERILFNLADNTAKYASGKNAPLLRLYAEISNKKTLKIHIADNGPGLSKHAKKNLFNEFSQSAQEMTDAEFHGLGIGLALSKRLAKLLGGDLTLEKSDASGTTFTLSLPVK